MSLDNEMKPTMKRGNLLPELNQEISEFKSMDKWPLSEFLEKFYHVDTQFRDESKDRKEACYRLQGYIYWRDLPENLPDEFINSEFDMVDDDGEIVFEVWSMIIIRNLPF